MLELNEPLAATVVLYLSNVSQGGQILFPESEVGGNNLDVVLFFLVRLIESLNL